MIFEAHVVTITLVIVLIKVLRSAARDRDMKRATTIPKHPRHPKQFIPPQYPPV